MDALASKVELLTKLYKKDDKVYEHLGNKCYRDRSNNNIVILESDDLELTGSKASYKPDKATKTCWTSLMNSHYMYGTEVSKDWKDFNNFVKDMGTKPEGLFLVRKDKMKGFYKENCEWASKYKYANKSYRHSRYT